MIHFKDIKKSTNDVGTRVDIIYSVNETSDKLYFQMNRKVDLDNDTLAVLLSTLCGRVYKKIVYDFYISDKILEELKKFTLADVIRTENTSTCINTLSMNDRKNVTLNFSGGFDSLAAYCLMRVSAKLCSMDYGGRFSRENNFFERFDTFIVSTNILDTELKKNSWSFMGSASILSNIFLQTKYNSFGSILESAPANISVNAAGAKNISFPPFKMLGMKNANYVGGLTEVGTALIILKYRNDLIKSSLESLASAGEEKRFKKQILIETVSNKFGYNISLEHIEPPVKGYFDFGTSFTTDFLLFYIIKNGSFERYSSIYKSVPQEVFDIANNLSLSFYERVNTDFYINFPVELKSDLYAKFCECELEFYTYNDWKEFDVIRTFLSKYYKDIELI
ncbi:hypothetical protein AB9G26_09115 [Francisella philomiragia]|uniref:hypothetical protein n=1 Tax=Francisella philomiragia TaxID=28110 RepID=UPI003512CC0F